MTNNDILRRLRYVFDFNDRRMISLFELAGVTVTREQVSDWLKKVEDDAHVPCGDSTLAAFLNGLITHKRGKKDGPLPVPEVELTNNIILRKLKIALNLRESDTLELMSLAGMPMGKPELTALFRNASHKHYRVCQDQILRNFLRGLQMKLRPSDSTTQILSISAEMTWDLRHRVLWPNQSIEFVQLPEDVAGEHWGLLVEGRLVSVVSLFFEENKARFRKFATEPTEQGKGYGSQLLSHLFDEASQRGAHEIGCRARVDTASFYDRFGLRSTGEKSSLAGVQYVYMKASLLSS